MLHLLELAIIGFQAAEINAITPRPPRAFLQPEVHAPNQSTGRTVLNERHLGRITFLYDSQAETCGLSWSLPAIWREEGFETCTRGTPYLCVKRVSPPGNPCKPFSTTTYLNDGLGCSSLCSNVYVHWVGINDAKVVSGSAVNLQADLFYWKQQVRSLCGPSIGLVFVQPPFFEHWVGTEMADIPTVQARVAAAYAAVTAGDLRALRIDGQALAVTSDFFNQQHFCQNAVQCATTNAIGAAIYEAVGKLSIAPTTAMFLLANPFQERLQKELEKAHLDRQNNSQEYNWTKPLSGPNSSWDS